MLCFKILFTYITNENSVLAQHFSRVAVTCQLGCTFQRVFNHMSAELQSRVVWDVICTTRQGVRPLSAGHFCVHLVSLFHVELNIQTNCFPEHPDPGLWRLSTVLRACTIGGRGSAPAACLLQLMEIYILFQNII